MSEVDLEFLKKAFDEFDLECDSEEKAVAQMQEEGLLDGNGQFAARYSEQDEAVICL